VYSGIDLVYYGNQRQLEYDFVVAPGANPHHIAFDVSGATQIHKDAHGDLLFKVGDAEMRWHKPVVYQEKDGKRLKVAAQYAITNNGRVAFELAKYDSSRTLYIDPLIYSTYLGGSDGDYGSAIAVDKSGNAYITGSTSSADFPTKNPAQPAIAGGGDVFVTKINAAGTALVYSTYLGGSDEDYCNGIAVDSAGNAYVTGVTRSVDFPTKNPVQSANAGNEDVFVAKINAAGSALLYSTYLGGSGVDKATGVVIDSAGNAYITGYTLSTDFPTANAIQPTSAGQSDAFVTKINATGSALLYSTYLGGSDSDWGQGIAVDSASNAYVIGSTSSTNFPTVNPIQPALAGFENAFVAKFNTAGSALVYSTYYGGPLDDAGNAIAADAAGNAYITGATYMYPCSFYNCFHYDFVNKVNATGSAFVYKASSGLSYGSGSGIVVGPAGSVYVVGQRGGNSDYPNYRTYVEKFSPSGTVIDSLTYLGGNNHGVAEGNYVLAQGIAKDSAGYAYIAGWTTATNFPTKNPLQPANAGGLDAFISKVDVRILSTITITSSPNPSTYGQAVTFTATVKPTKYGLAQPPNGETVSFVKGTKVLGTGTLSGGTATFTTSSLPKGIDKIQAVYGGDTNYAPSHSAPLPHTVN
jgi:hypothetical protein